MIQYSSIQHCAVQCSEVKCFPTQFSTGHVAALTMWGENIPVERFNEMQRGEQWVLRDTQRYGYKLEKDNTVEIMDDF